MIAGSSHKDSRNISWMPLSFATRASMLALKYSSKKWVETKPSQKWTRLRARVLFVASFNLYFSKRKKGCQVEGKHTVNPNVPAILQPLNQHLKTIMSQLFTGLGCLRISMTEPWCSVIFLDATSSMKFCRRNYDDVMVEKDTHCWAFCLARVRRSWPTLNTL